MKTAHATLALPAEDLLEAVRRSSGYRSPRNGAQWHRRRRAMAKEVVVPAGSEALSIGALLQAFWDRHAIKSGIVGFWLWFAVANRHALLGLYQQAATFFAS